MDNDDNNNNNGENNNDVTIIGPLLSLLSSFGPWRCPKSYASPIGHEGSPFVGHEGSAKKNIAEHRNRC